MHKNKVDEATWVLWKCHEFTQLAIVTPFHSAIVGRLVALPSDLLCLVYFVLVYIVLHNSISLEGQGYLK